MCSSSRPTVSTQYLTGIQQEKNRDAFTQAIDHQQTLINLVSKKKSR